MKRLFLLLFFIPLISLAQVPQGVGYQGVATDANGIELVNQTISIRASVLSGSANGTVEWEETHATSTDTFGLFALTIGEGTSTGNGAQLSFADISWGTNTHYLKIEMDVTGGANYSFMGTNQMMSVPYALYAENANIDYDSISNLLSNDSTFITNIGGGMGGGGCDYSFPEGLYGEVITEFLTKPSNFSVPLGKTLYITNWYSNSGSNLEIVLNGQGRPIARAFNANMAPFDGIVHPIILRNGDVIETSNNGGEGWFNGILIPSKAEVEPLSIEVSDQITYTVPSGKMYVITNVYKFSGDEMRINSQPIIQAENALTQQIFAKSGDVIDATGAQGIGHILNGYLVDENYFANCGGGGSNASSGLDSIAVANMIAAALPPPVAQIGDFRDGGVVFWVDGSGQHGLVCDLQDLGTAEWGCTGSTIGVYGTGIGTGQQNTIDILNGCANASIAAELCINSTAQGYSDWFLPSKDALQELYNNAYAINFALVMNGGSGFVDGPGDSYWSSSEVDHNAAYDHIFSNGTPAYSWKNNTFYVRAVRAF